MYLVQGVLCEGREKRKEGNSPSPQEEGAGTQQNQPSARSLLPSASFSILSEVAESVTSPAADLTLL